MTSNILPMLVDDVEWRDLYMLVSHVQSSYLAQVTSMVNIASRPFAATDLPRIVDFVVAANQQQGESGYLHVGDVLWRLYQNTVFDPAQHVRVWEDADGALVGFAWHEEPDGVVMQVHPPLRGLGVLEPLMIAWGAAHVDTASPAYDGHLWTRLCDTDSTTIATLATAGFERDESYALKMRYSLDEPLVSPQLPPGFSVRAVGGEDEWAARVVLHQEVWRPSAVTLDAYQQLRDVAGYRPDLDLVVVAPDTTFAAYCICWLDRVNRTGEFEPVGTRTAFRGEGLGKAVMREGLRRLREQGVHTAYVTAVGDNDAARRLYEAVGFTTYTREYAYRKPLP